MILYLFCFYKFFLKFIYYKELLLTSLFQLIGWRRILDKGSDAILELRHCLPFCTILAQNLFRFLLFQLGYRPRRLSF